VALSADRNTAMRDGNQLSLPVKASTKIYAGAIVVLDAGYAKGGAAAASLIAMGRAEEQVNNIGADGAKNIIVRRGVFKFANSSGDAVTVTEVGKDVYIEDDQTVCKTSTDKSAAGKCIGLDSDGVWVEIK